VTLHSRPGNASSLPRLRPRLVACDLDGTLFPLNDPRVQPAVVSGVAALLRAGVRFVISTGRMFRSAKATAASFGVTEGTIVCYQGAVVANLATGERLLARPVTSELAADVVRTARSLRRHVNAYIDDELHVEELDRLAEMYMQRGAVGATVDADLEAAVLSSAPDKLLVLTEPDDAPALLPVFRQRWAGRLAITISQPGYVEITAPEATKRGALEFLAQEWGLDACTAVACGDGLNDLDMLEWAGFAVAMAEAVARVREAADVVLPQVEIGGLFERLAMLPERPS
jgi:Cof subfamily protein (haloacid dehalogenase superfamily)